MLQLLKDLKKVSERLLTIRNTDELKPVFVSVALEKVFSWQYWSYTKLNLPTIGTL